MKINGPRIDPRRTQYLMPFFADSNLPIFKYQNSRINQGVLPINQKGHYFKFLIQTNCF